MKRIKTKKLALGTYAKEYVYTIIKLGSDLVLLAFRDVDTHGVLDTEGLALIVVTGLQGDRARGIGRELEDEGMGVGAELAQQPVLDRRVLLLLLLQRHDLLPTEDQLLAELDAHDLVLLSAIAVDRRHLNHPHVIRCKFLSRSNW